MWAHHRAWRPRVAPFEKACIWFFFLFSDQLGAYWGRELSRNLDHYRQSLVGIKEKWWTPSNIVMDLWDRTVGGSSLIPFSSSRIQLLVQGQLWVWTFSKVGYQLSWKYGRKCKYKMWSQIRNRRWYKYKMKCWHKYKMRRGRKYKMRCYHKYKMRWDTNAKWTDMVSCMLWCSL